MSKRTRAQRDEEEKEEALRQIPDEEAEDLMEVVETAHEQGVSPLVLLSIMDMGSEARDLIVRAAMPNIHAFLAVDVTLHRIVHDTLGDMFRRGVRDAVRRLRAWNGQTWGEVQKFLGDLGELLLQNPSLTPAWFLRTYGLNLVYNDVPFANVLWDPDPWTLFMTSFEEGFMRDHRDLDQNEIDDMRLDNRSVMRLVLTDWMDHVSPGSDEAWHALLWELVARYQLVMRDDGDFLENLPGTIDVRFLSQWACRLILAIRLTPPEAQSVSFRGIHVTPEMGEAVYTAYWFRLPRSRLSANAFDLTPELIQAYRHQHPDAPEPTPHLYRAPTLALFLGEFAAYQPDDETDETDAFSQLARRDAGLPNQGHSVVETFLPLSTYTIDEWRTVVRELNDNYEPILARPLTDPFWVAIRDDLSARLWAIVTGIPTLKLAVLQEESRTWAIMIRYVLNLDTIHMRDLLYHWPSHRPPDLVFLLLYWFQSLVYDHTEPLNWLLNPRAEWQDVEEEGPLLDIQVPLALPGFDNHFVGFLLSLHLPTVSGTILRRIEVFLGWERESFLRVVYRLLHYYNVHLPNPRFFQHNLSAIETAQALCHFIAVNRLIVVGSSAFPLESGQLLRLLLRGSRDSPRQVFAEMVPLFPARALLMNDWESVFFPRRDPNFGEAEVQEVKEEEEDENRGAPISFSSVAHNIHVQHGWPENGMLLHGKDVAIMPKNSD